MQLYFRILREKGVPVDAINPVHYGMCNGAEVLKFAQGLVK